MESWGLCARHNREFEAVLAKLGELIQDTDDIQAKEQVKELRRDLSDVVRILVIGSEHSGRTTFWKRLLLREDSERTLPTSGIEEIRCGDQEAFFTVEPGYTRRFLHNPDLEGIAVFDTGEKEVLKGRKIRELAAACDVAFVLFSAENIQAPAVWDFLESGLDWKKTVFILTMADRYSQVEIRNKLDKIKLFMSEAGISAPVFPVSAGEHANYMEQVRAFTDDTILSSNPKLKKYQENICVVRNFINELGASFNRRYEQFESDYRIMERLDHQFNTFRENHLEHTKRLEDELRLEIHERITEYEKEIIARLDPKTIKERFKKRKDFSDYLELVTLNYQTLLNRSVEHKVQATIKNYLHELELVYDEAAGLLANRPQMLELEDRFYGSLAQSKKEITIHTNDMVTHTSKYYNTLYNASEELFLKIWQERDKYDRKVNTASKLGFSIGIAGGLEGAAALSTALGSGLATTISSVFGSGTAAAAVNAGLSAVGVALGTGILVPAVTLASGVAIGILSKHLAAALLSPHMEKEVDRCIQEFRQDVAAIREQLTGQVLSEVKKLFDRELDRADKSFLEFRTCTNIDSRRLPDMKQELQQISGMLEMIAQG